MNKMCTLNQLLFSATFIILNLNSHKYAQGDFIFVIKHIKQDWETKDGLQYMYYELILLNQTARNQTTMYMCEKMMCDGYTVHHTLPFHVF